MVLPPTATVNWLGALADGDGARADDAGASHASRDHGRVAGLAADRRQDSLGDVHSVNVVGRGFLADQNHGTGLRHLDGFFGGERSAAHGGAGRSVDTGGDQGQLLQRRRIEDRMQKLIELLRLHAQHGLLLIDHAFFDHIHGDAHRRRTGALAVAGLQHVQLAFFDGELEILHVAIVLFETRR